MTIERLTEGERAAVAVDFDGLGSKAIRIIDVQAARIAELERETHRDLAEAALDAAEARIAELERDNAIQAGRVDAAAREAGVALADAYERAEAAERLAEERLGIISAQAAQMSANDCDRWLKLHGDWGRAESEAAALRAEVERLRKLALQTCGEDWAIERRRLAAANALLRDARPESYVVKKDWLARRDAHLAAQKDGSK